MITENLTVPEEAKEKRIDSYLAGVFAAKLSRTKVKELILSGQVLVNDVRVKPNFIIYPGQDITVEYEESFAPETRAEKIPLKIIHEDKDLIVIDKPAGMVVHPAHGNTSGTLVNALLYHTKALSKLGGDIRAGIVHRLDKDTSGVILVTKNDKAHEFVARQFKKHEVEKIYWAVVRGVAQHDEMRADEPLGRSDHDRRKVVVQRETGKESKTNFKVLKRFKTATLIEARPETGRTHQIRVHLKHLGYPVLGDADYGIPSEFIERQALHAKEISIIHPRTKKRVTFKAEPPKDFAKLLKSKSL